MSKINSRIRKTIRAVGVLILYCICLSAFYHLIRRGDIFPYDDLRTGLISYGVNLIPTMILTLCNVWIIFRLVERSRLSRYLPVKILADFAASTLMMYLFIWTFTLANRPFNPELRVDVAGVFLNNVLIVMTLEIIYYFRRSREALKKAEHAKTEALQYQYDALKSQVNPHFLFNSLNILLSLIDKDARKANDFTIALSHIYRYVLSIQNKTSVMLKEELDFLQSYVSILEIRYNRSFSLSVKYASDSGERCIVPFTLQLLVENVTKHNIISGKNPMQVELVVGEDCVSVSNPIKLKENNSPSGIGLKYIAEQYDINGKKFRVENDGSRFTALVPYL